MRRPRDKSWNVEIAPRAWDQLGTMSGESFRKLKRALDVVRDELESGDQPALPGTQQIAAAGYVARYRAEAQLRSVILDEVFRDEGAKDDLTSTGRRRRKG